MKRTLASNLARFLPAALSIFFIVGSTLAQQAADSSKALTPLALPGVFNKADPQSLADARAIENHVVTLINHVRPVTVALRVGNAFGSGVIVSEDGIILTAGHVIGKPGRRVEVTMSDGSKVQATTLGRNRAIDSGMIQLPKDRKWTHAQIAQPATIKAGGWCLAMGHPGGFDEERGVVTRLGRVIASRKRFVQTDCELVGGDSGGPLFDMAGRVIAIHSRIGESANFNFHVPAAVYRDEWDRLAASEDFAGHSGALMGVTGVPADGGRGLRITTVHSGEPAEKAGFRTGDVLVLFDGKEVNSLNRLIELVGERLPGHTVIAEVVRDGRAQKLKVELGMRWD